MRPIKKNAPEWATYMAMQPCGDWYWFKELPYFQDIDAWYLVGHKFTGCSNKNGNNWKESVTRLKDNAIINIKDIPKIERIEGCNKSCIMKITNTDNTINYYCEDDYVSKDDIWISKELVCLSCDNNDLHTA